MFKYTFSVEGMACGMCEAHINEAVRRALPVKKVRSSYRRGETVVISDGELDESALRAAVEATGCEARGVERELYAKHGIFG